MYFPVKFHYIWPCSFRGDVLKGIVDRTDGQLRNNQNQLKAKIWIIKSSSVHCVGLPDICMVSPQYASSDVCTCLQSSLPFYHTQYTQMDADLSGSADEPEQQNINYFSKQTNSQLQKLSKQNSLIFCFFCDFFLTFNSLFLY